MKYLAIVLMSLFTLSAQAELDHDGIKKHTTQQQLSKRPYSAPVAKETFDGAAVVVDKEVDQPKKLNLHMLDRRPYVQKASQD
jgi:hypothetical protein